MSIEQFVCAVGWFVWEAWMLPFIRFTFDLLYRLTMAISKTLPRGVLGRLWFFRVVTPVYDAMWHFNYDAC